MIIAPNDKVELTSTCKLGIQMHQQEKLQGQIHGNYRATCDYAKTYYIVLRLILEELHVFDNIKLCPQYLSFQRCQGKNKKICNLGKNTSMGNCSFKSKHAKNVKSEQEGTI